MIKMEKTTLADKKDYLVDNEGQMSDNFYWEDDVKKSMAKIIQAVADKEYELDPKRLSWEDVQEIIENETGEL